MTPVQDIRKRIVERNAYRPGQKAYRPTVNMGGAIGLRPVPAPEDIVINNFSRR